MPIPDPRLLGNLVWEYCPKSLNSYLHKELNYVAFLVGVSLPVPTAMSSQEPSLQNTLNPKVVGGSLLDANTL